MIIACNIENIVLPTNFPTHQKTVITIGNFDGVHLGHQTLLKKMTQHAHTQNAKTVVITFEPHPQKVLRGSSPIPLTTREDKLSLIKQAGIDVIFQLQFSLKVASMDTETFIQQILLDKLKMKELIIGHDFSMGHNQTGTKNVITILGKKLSFAVTALSPVFIQEETISSSNIRNKLEHGLVDSAAVMLGRLYTIAGTVLAGEKRGQKIGFPTINLQLPPILTPLHGVYVTLVTLYPQNISQNHSQQRNTKKTFLGVTNIGVNPSFKKTKSPIIETHILNFSGSLYGEHVSISFIERLRAEQYFQDINLLTAQIETDIFNAKKVFKNTIGLILE